MDSSPISFNEPLPGYVSQLEVSIDNAAAESLPPDYPIAVGRPLRPITYIFSDLTDNAVLLTPKGHQQTVTPLYRISTSLRVHPFIPLSITTIVRRGGTVEGPFVGSFEIGTQFREYTRVLINNRSSKLTTFLNKISDRQWNWTVGTIRLRWDCRETLDDGSPLCICYSAVLHDQLATLVPPPVESFIHPQAEPTLTVFPDGHGENLDHILLSGLAIQRLLL